MKHFFTLLSVLAALSALSAVEIVKDGKAAAEIALPEKPVSSVKFAAGELQKHIQLITGIRLPVTVKSAPRKLPNRIHLGYGTAPKNKNNHAWRVKAGAKDLYLAGNDTEISSKNLACPERTMVGWCVASSGTLLAVYDFLDRELKVRWLRPDDGGIYVTPSKNISVKAFDRESAPGLMTASFSYSPISSAKLWHDKKFGVRHSLQTKLWGIRHRFVDCNWFHKGHAFGNWWKRYGRKHPEYFARLHDGTRRPLKGDRSGKRITMCVSSPALMKQIVENYKAGLVDKDGEEIVTPQYDSIDWYFAVDENASYTKGDAEEARSSEITHVFKNDSEVGELPLITKQTYPQISGVLICAEGANSPQVKNNIVIAVEALLGVKSHRIEVLERK